MRTVIRTFAVCCILAGLCMAAYPYASSWLLDYHTRKEMAVYKEQISAGNREEELRRAEAYNAALLDSPLYFYDPFTPDGQTEESTDTYMTLLNADEDGLIGYLKIPKISLNLGIYHGASDSVLLKGCGHLAGSSFPIGTCPSSTVICGHTGQPSARLFSDLDQLESGDRFSISIFGRDLEYEVTEVQKILPDELDQYGNLQITEGQEKITLLTCTPYGINTHRLLVHGCRVLE